jgi:predicted NBD/HSP70 family sugar kinase
MPATQAARGDLVPSAILGMLGTRGPLSRADLARTLGVSPATITQTTKALISHGLVTELEQVPSAGGRPARLLGLVRSAGGAIGVKVTADHLAIVDVELDGTVISSTTLPFDPDSPNALDHLGHALRNVMGQRADRQLLGIGVGIPGSVDSQDTGVVDAPTLSWTDAQVGPALRASLGVPVLVENDVNTLAVAERLYGIGQSHLSYLVVTIGRGIGCGIVVDGAVYRGAGGGAGEIGHIPISVDGPRCGCGAHGCLEAHIGDAGLVRSAQDRGLLGPAGTTAQLRELAASSGPAATAAARVYADAGELLGRALAGVVHTVDPEIVVILGEGIDAWQHWEPGFELAFRRHLMPARRGLTYVVEPWADDKWALGAAALVLASPFDVVGTSGDQGRLVRERLHAPGGTP